MFVHIRLRLDGRVAALNASESMRVAAAMAMLLRTSLGGVDVTQDNVTVDGESRSVLRVKIGVGG